MKSTLNCSIVSWVKATSFLLLISSVLFVFQSCSDAELSDLKTDKGDVLFNTRYTDTTTVVLQTIRESTLRSDEFTNDVIGAYSDNIIGKVQSIASFEVRLPATEIKFFSTDVYNSAELVLNLAHNGRYFGDTTQQVTLRVYQLNQRIYQDSSYNSDEMPEYLSNELGSVAATINPWDSVQTIHIKLDDIFGQSIMEEPTATYNQTESFLDFMKGFIVIPDIPVNGGWIGNFQLEDDSTYLGINYNDSLSVKFAVNSLSARILSFKHDYTGSEIETQLNDTNKIFEKVFLQPLAGVKIRVRFPYIKNYIDSGNIAVHKAEILFKKDETSPYLDNSPGTLLLLNTNKENENLTLLDRYEDHYGGTFVEDKDAYSVILTRHLQLLLNSYANDADFDADYGLNLIIPSDNPIIAMPLILLQKESNGSYTTKLRLHYTRP